MIRRPLAIVVLLTALNLFNYLDRYVLSAVLPKLQADLGMSKFAGGMLATVFLIGYFATSPFFGMLADRGDRGKRTVLMAMGIVVWSVATIASGLATGLWSLVLARAFVGVGEASYATIAPTLIDDLAPPDKKGALPRGLLRGHPRRVGARVLHRRRGRGALRMARGLLRRRSAGLVLALLCLAVVEPRRRTNDAKENVWKGRAPWPPFPSTVEGYWGIAPHLRHGGVCLLGPHLPL